MIRLDFLDMVFSLDLDPFPIKLLLRKLLQRLVERTQDTRSDIVDRDPCERSKSGESSLKVGSDEIVKFSSEFYSGGSAPNNDKV